MEDPDREIVKRVFGNVCRYCIYYGECPDFLEGLLRPEKLKEWENIDEREGCGWFELTRDARVELNERGYYYSDKLRRWVKAIVLEWRKATRIRIDENEENVIFSFEGESYEVEVKKLKEWLRSTKGEGSG